MDKMAADYLFVSGCGRSGTTLITRILASHPNIVLGSERYMKLYSNNFNEFSPSLFEFERYFDFRPSDSGHFAKEMSVATEQYYDRMRRKWSERIYVGDKITTFFERFDVIHERFKRVKFIHVTRNIDDVARSWDARVKLGTLPPTYNYKKAVKVWNDSLERSLQYYDAHPSNISLINFEHILEDGNISRLLKDLNSNLDSGPVQAFIDEMKRCSPKLEERRQGRALSEQQREYIEKHARYDLYEKCMRASVF